MPALRTPDDRFAGLPGFPFEPHYVEVDAGDVEGWRPGKLRVHYLDEGPADGRSCCCMHGEPSWCFLYRKMIPVLAAAGLRCIAPDLVGFGRSDKPTEPRRLHVPRVTSSGCVPHSSTRSTCTTSRSSARTGVA